jgi:DNA polymerase III subunit epsilon
MSASKIAVVDVETTGLSPWKHDRIVEIAIVVTGPDGTVQAEYDTLVNPSRDMGPTSIHRITAADVLGAPKFADIAGDVLELLSQCDILAGHNVSFDKNFLKKEFERVGVEFPDVPTLCTCSLLGRGSLLACCEDLGIVVEGMPHRALSDARATAGIVLKLCSEEPELLESHRIIKATWPELRSLRTPCFRREHAEKSQLEPSRFLQRITSMIRHDVEAQAPDVLAYMVLIDRVLEDRVIERHEEEALVDAAMNWRLSPSQLQSAHAQYLHSLVVAALADGVVSTSERRDLHLVARLLGQDDSALDQMLDSAVAQLAAASKNRTTNTRSGEDLNGRSVCFTGELQATINGRPLTRDIAHTLASDAGLQIASNVTKSLDILVVADPNTQSGKATKARSYGVRILSDVVFWRMIGVAVD